MAGTATADTLREALVSAYQTNPTLTAQREALKATDATVAIARAAGRPQVSGTVGLNRDLTRSGVIAQTAGQGTTTSARRGARPQLPFIQRRARQEFGHAPRNARRGRPRDAARRRRRRLHPGGRGLHGRDPRPLDRRAEPEQREGARDQPRGDARPLPDRRPDPHRRRPVRSAASARPLAACRLRRAD